MLLPLAALFVPAGRPGAEVNEPIVAPEPVAVARDHLAALRARVAAGEAGEDTLAELRELALSLVPLAAPAAEPSSTPGGPAEEAEVLLLSTFELRLRVLTQLGGLPSGYRGDFIAAVAPGAMYSDAVEGVPASITIAQAIIESGWGKSAPGNNLFGMKGVGPAGSERRRVVEYRHGKRGYRRDPFRAYHTYAESIEDHARVLATSSRYAEARAVAEDPAAYAAALQGRYATDPRYARKLLDISGRYALDQFDWAPSVTPALADAAE